ncbi:unnamed protein product [Candidula unifasciata]|uniref:Uncharacterized protein n=1 Tax=Candidula unifasciata TaxID=100452 RepID=A0A8S3YQI8_9EUPU|nr:unnamed protein product [Candidula unifasciata]
MSEVGLQISSSSMDSYLRQVVPVLQTCRQAVREITQRDLKIQGKDRGTLVLHVIFEIRPDEQQGKRLRSRNPSSADVKTDEEAFVLIEQVKMFADKLRDVALKVLDVRKEMEREDSTLSRKIKKLTELKKSLDEFTRLLDTIVNFYSAKLLGFHPTVDLPALEDVKKLKEQLSHLKSQLKKDELSSLFASYDAEFSTSNEVIICTMLGLNDDYGYYLQELDTEVLMHQPILYYLQKSIESQENEWEADGILHQSGKKVLAENLHRFGFTKETAALIVQHIPDEFVDLQRPSYWAVRYLDHMCRHHPLLSFNLRYPQNQHLVDEWFELKLLVDSGKATDSEDAKPSFSGIRYPVAVEHCLTEVAKLDLATPKGSVAVQSGLTEMRDSEAAKLNLTEIKHFEDANLCAVRMINISSDKSLGNVLVQTLLKELKSDENVLLFHGTTHENAMSVVANGIILTKGSKRQDFSNGDGFYLSDKFENARAWSQAGRGGHQAVVVYNVNRSLLNSDENSGLDLSQNLSRWEEVVRCCRNGYTNRKMTKSLKKYAFIQGPPCKNPGDIEGSNPLQPLEEASIQLCIRDDSFAEEFGTLSNVACVIFY